jgi:simple sugar transport system permease protein
MVAVGILGVLSAFAGVTHSFLSRHFEPTLFMTQNLDVIAAVILGGASVTGGRGSVLGTFMGVILIQLINRAMILTGITVEWHS